MSTTCKDSIDLLREYTDGELTDELRAKLEDHLCDCPPCEDFLRTYKETPGVCRQALKAAIPEEMANRLTDFLRQHMCCKGDDKK
jgi:anti-sigma factor RsiW